MDEVTLDVIQFAGIIIMTLGVGLLIGALIGHLSATIDHQKDL